MNAKRILSATALAVATFVSVQPASAADGVWRVGSTYVLRYENVDLDTAQGRAALLDMVETGARRLCRAEPATRRAACAAEAAEKALAAADQRAQEAVETALLERDGSLLALR